MDHLNELISTRVGTLLFERNGTETVKDNRVRFRAIDVRASDIW
jgi:hypothetical protein